MKQYPYHTCQAREGETLQAESGGTRTIARLIPSKWGDLPSERGMEGLEGAGYRLMGLPSVSPPARPAPAGFGAAIQQREALWRHKIHA